MYISQRDLGNDVDFIWMILCIFKSTFRYSVFLIFTTILLTITERASNIEPRRNYLFILVIEQQQQQQQ